MSSIRVRSIDSHTEGEPTRVVFEGGPGLPRVSLRERVDILRRDHDWFRAGVCCEPRGSEVMVGALLCQPTDPTCVAAVIFFNDVGYLGMCGHGTIGLVHTLAHLGRIDVGTHRIETPVGVVETVLCADDSVRVDNVESFRYRAAVELEVAGLGRVVGDVAWGGNWFFLVREYNLELSLRNRATLLQHTHAIREALHKAGIRGREGAEIDHIELFGAPENSENHSRNFVLCPGASFDRSPCGTGTSAKMACLHAEGILQPGQEWRQEGILGTHFTGTIRVTEDGVLPSIRGRAWITAESTLLFDASDPFRFGICF
jgi:4-hydroxyproline epimerase